MIPIAPAGGLVDLMRVDGHFWFVSAEEIGMADEKARLERQFDAIARDMPPARRIIDPLLRGRLSRFRLPIACGLILGSFLWILPVFGLWMLPLGLLLLAFDVPRLRPAVSRLLIRGRRRIGIWRRKRSAE